jgi:diaminopimelate decarboxylase
MIDQKILSGELQTPLYAYDASVIAERCNELQNQKPNNLEIFYAIKANSSLGIIKEFVKRDFGLEIASGGELFLAKQLGVPGEKVIYTGPAKSDTELTEAVEYGLQTIHVESLHEAVRLNSICEKRDKKQEILLRINADFEIHTHVQLSGCPSPFGVSEEDAETAIAELLTLQNLRLRGVHVYNASGVMDYKQLLQNVENVFLLSKKLEERFGIQLAVIDFGGGLGIDYASKNRIDVTAFYKGLHDLIKKHDAGEKHLVMEIGRYLVAECGKYIVQIVDIKKSRGKTFYITNGGIHHFLRSKMFNAPHPVRAIKKTKDLKRETVTITGSLCTSADVLAEDVEVAKCNIGDYVVIEKTGAYGLSVGLSHFLSHNMPAEILYDQESYQVIREPGKYEDLLLNQKISR